MDRCLRYASTRSKLRWTLFGRATACKIRVLLASASSHIDWPFTIVPGSLPIATHQKQTLFLAQGTDWGPVAPACHSPPARAEILRRLNGWPCVRACHQLRFSGRCMLACLLARTGAHINLPLQVMRCRSVPREWPHGANTRKPDRVSGSPDESAVVNDNVVLLLELRTTKSYSYTTDQIYHKSIAHALKDSRRFHLHK